MSIPYHLDPGASQNNAFTSWLDGSPSIFAKHGNKDNGAAVAATLARKRDAGVDVPETPMVKRGPKAKPGAQHYKHTNVYSKVRAGE